MSCVLVESQDLPVVRTAVGALVGRGRRLHFHQETDSTREQVLELVGTLPVRAQVVTCIRSHGVTEFNARDACLGEIVSTLQASSVGRLTIESRQDDRDDHRTILRVRQKQPFLSFEHRQGLMEPMLWIADAVAWSFGAGAPWIQRVEPILDRTVELRP
jgi:hypothetical protein